MLRITLTILLLLTTVSCTGIYVKDLPLPDKPDYPTINVESIKAFADYYMVPKQVMLDIKVKDVMCRGYANEMRQIILSTH